MAAAGDVIGGYTLVRRLGSGGMGTVWEAHEPAGGAVALKLLHPAIAADPDARARLAREVASLNRVRGHRVARVLDAEIDADLAFVVTQLVEGLTLEESVAQEGAFDPVDLHPLAVGLAEAVEQVHAAGLLHRDIKPGNVMVTYDGPVLIDFGIAQLAEDSRLTHTGFVTGTPGYLDPATLNGSTIGQAGDWYGWAAVMLFAATGRAPFGRDGMSAVLVRMTAGEPDTLGLEPGVAAAFRAALAVQVAHRPAPRELLEALRLHAAGLPVPLPTQPVPPPPVPTAAMPAPTAPLAPPVRRSAAGAAGMAGVAGAAGAPGVGPTVPAPLPPVHRPGAPAPLGGHHPGAWPAVGNPAGHPAGHQGANPAGQLQPGHQGFVPGAVPGAPSGTTPVAVPGSLTTPRTFETWELPPPPHAVLVAVSGLLTVALAVRWPGIAVVLAVVSFVLLTAGGLTERRTRRRRLAAGLRRSDPWVAAAWSLPMLPVALVTALVPLLVGAVVAVSVWWIGTRVVLTDLVAEVPDTFAWTIAPLALAAGLTVAWWVPLADVTRVGARALWHALAPSRAAAQVWGAVGLSVAAVLGLLALTGDVSWVPFPAPPVP